MGHELVIGYCSTLASRVKDVVEEMIDKQFTVSIYPVPRGGVPVVYLLLNFLGKSQETNLFAICEKPEDADIFIDDILMTGKTREKYRKYGKPFLPLIDKNEGSFKTRWIVFPWEDSPAKEKEQYISQILEFIGENPTREGLKDTPSRVVRTWKELYKGYTQNVGELCTIFEEDIKNDATINSMVICKDNEFFSMCEHHMLPFYGKISVIYQPHKKVLGLSKIPRVIDMFSRRLQIQERLTNQICEAINDMIEPKFVYVVCDAKHLCVQSRGVLKYNTEMRTTAYKRSEGVDNYDEIALQQMLNDFRR